MSHRGARRLTRRAARPGLLVVALSKPARATWSVLYAVGTYRCTGPYTSRSTAVFSTTGMVRPGCK